MSAEASQAGPALSHRVMEQAAEWFALLRSGEASAADRERWRQWLAGADEHQQAWRYVEHVGRRFAPLRASPQRETAVRAFGKAAAEGPRRQRRVVLGGLMAAATGWLGWAGWRHTPLPALAAGWRADHRAGVGETRRVQLPDGTQVWLRALSAFNVDYSGSLRRLQLVDGEILVDTGSDPARPFVVATGQGQLQALGTRFSVRQESDGVLLAVYGGAVRVVTARRQATGVVPAGQQAYFTADALRAMVPASPAREAWARGILVADGMPLGQVVEELRRYHTGHLGMDPEVADLRVFGSYPLDDLPHALDMLASVLPVRVRRPMSWWLSIEARR